MKKILLSVFVFSILLPTLAFASFDTSLKYGSHGDGVLELQDMLKAQGFLSGNVDGRYGLVTLNAVKAFQSANGLPPDGYFGKASRAKASTILAEQLQSSNTAEQAETGAIAPISTISGCTSTSVYSPTTGKPCNSTTQPTTPNLPAGCSSTSGFSITTGQACNGLASTVQQLQQTVQQIQQNTQQIAQNTQPSPVVVPPPVTVTLGNKQCVIHTEDIGTKQDFDVSLPQPFYPLIVSTDYAYASLLATDTHSDGTQGNYNRGFNTPKMPYAYVGITNIDMKIGDVVQYDFKVYKSLNLENGSFIGDTLLGETSGTVTITSC